MDGNDIRSVYLRFSLAVMRICQLPQHGLSESHRGDPARSRAQKIGSLPEILLSWFRRRGHHSALEI